MSFGILMPAQFSGSYRLRHELPHKAPHCTLIYLGENPTMSVMSKVMEACGRLSRQVVPQMVPVTGVALFGHNDHTVLTLKTEVLVTWRDFIDKELRRDGIVSAWKWTFKPHVTINKHTVSSEPILPWDDFQVPATVWLERPQVWWSEG